MPHYPSPSQFTTATEFSGYVRSADIDIPSDDEVETGPHSPLAQPISAGGFEIGNRFAILPLEGWDSDIDGNPTDGSLGRWAAFGRSGAKLIWGESAAVRKDGRSSVAQLLIAPTTAAGLRRLRDAAVSAHREEFGDTGNLKLGLQLTHSGRLSHPAPSGDHAPVTVRRHPHLDATLGPPPDQPLLTDGQLYELIDDYAIAAEIVGEAGFDFVDLKACHGSLGHEVLGAYERPGEFGGSFDNRTRFLRTIVDRVRSSSPDLKLGLRLSAFDTVVHSAGEDGVGHPITSEPARYWFGTDESGHEIDLSEPIRLLTIMKDMGVDLICVTGSSPYNAWHFQRPALKNKPGEYVTPENPLVGVARHIDVTNRLRRSVPGITTVGSGYSYLQRWLPNVAQATVRAGMTDLVGIARMQIAYPRFISEVLDGRPLDTDAIERAF
ncbi:MAG TPA: NADH:flavin oxidoreductase [Acidimicrobiia bacterium]|nr:NADH:flavin oxidoreductase [Acidimicrobiia bacterium]